MKSKFYLICMLCGLVGCSVYGVYYNWNMTRAESIVDPINWILLFVFTMISFIARKL